MTPPPPTPDPRWVGVLVILASTVAEATGQLAWKRSTQTGTALTPVGRAIANRRWLLLGIAGFSVDALLWSVALKRLDVSVAHPIGSLVFVVTALLSRAILRERIPPRRWLGIALILAGSVVVALA